MFDWNYRPKLKHKFSLLYFKYFLLEQTRFQIQIFFLISKTFRSNAKPSTYGYPAPLEEKKKEDKEKVENGNVSQKLVYSIWNE